MARPSSRLVAASLCGSAALAVSLRLGACGDLPVVELGVCGNRVLEPELGEDCDGSAGRFGSAFACGEPAAPALVA